MKANTLSQTNRPRILVLGPGPTQVGGVATFMEILLSSAHMRQKYELLHLDTTRGPRGEGVASQFAFINLFYFFRQVARFFWMVLRYHPRLFHLPVNSFWAFWKNAAFILMARVMGMKVIAHLHGGYFDRYYWESPWLFQFLIGWVMCRADVVIALSDHWRRFLLNDVRSDIAVEVVPNTVDCDFVELVNETVIPANLKSKLVLFVGTLGYNKGVFDILKVVPQVIDRIPKVCFLFAGRAEAQDVRIHIDQVCTERNLDGCVRFLGLVTGQEKLELFQKSSVFVLPSHAENMPYALLEAMGAGLPVVTTSVGAIPELVKDGVNGFLIRPGDHEALADRLIRLLTDYQLRMTMSAANRKRIRDGYLPQMAMAKFDGIYNKLLEDEKP